MAAAPLDFPETKRNLRAVPLALVMGIALGLFVNGYWLSSVLPASSRLLILMTAVICAAGSVVCWLVLTSIMRCLRDLRWKLAAQLMLAAAATGTLLFFAGTAQWRDPARCITLLLPRHRLELRASGDAPRGIALAWFNTSIGDVSYGTMNMSGWKRVGDELVLEDPAHNSIAWQGATGDGAQLIFRSPAASKSLTVSWDALEERLVLDAGKTTYSHRFPVPWYASGRFVDVLGIMLLTMLALLALLALRAQRHLVSASLTASLAASGEWESRETAFLIGAAVLALLLRLINLGSANPAVDEYFHLIAARQIVEGAALGSVYDRALWLVTLPVSLAFRVFGYELWAARVVGAVFNVLGIWPLYVLARRINRPIAVLSVLLFVTSPWVTTFARLTREYAYYPAFAYAIILGMLSFIDRVPRNFGLSRDWKTLLDRKTVLLGIALLLPPLFAFFIDPSSTFRVMMIAYVVFAAFVLARFDWRDRLNLSALAVIGVAVVVAGYAAYLRDSGRIVAVPWINPVPVQYFFPDPPQQWYFDRLAIVAVVATVVAAVCSIWMRRASNTAFFVLCLYGTYLAFFTFLSKKFFHTRHLSTTELWYIMLLATGLYFGWRIMQALRLWKRRTTGIAVAAVLALSFTNVGQLLLPVTSTSPDNAISEDYLHNMSAVQAYLATHVQPGDVLISTVYGLYNSWVETPRFQANYRITTETPRDELLNLVDRHESGWIVIDKIRLEMSDLGPRAFAGNPDVEYIGLFGDQNVWHWRHAPESVGNTMVAGKAP